jgi:hypothetical protein
VFNGSVFSLTNSFFVIRVVSNEQVHYFENSKLHGSFKGVKDNLKKHIQYWKDIGANEFILGTIAEGYVIPFSSNSPRMCLVQISK